MMMNQRTSRTGRLCGFSVIGLPEIWDSLTMFMSCTFCRYRLSSFRRQLLVEMRSNCGLVKSDAAQDEFAKLPFEAGRIAIGQARHRGQPRQRHRQQGVMGEPEQIERLAADLRRLAARHRTLDRRGEYRPDQTFDLGIEQPGKLAVVEMACRHQPQAFRL